MALINKEISAEESIQNLKNIRIFGYGNRIWYPFTNNQRLNSRQYGDFVVHIMTNAPGKIVN